MAGAGLIILFLMLFSGFIIARSSVQPYWIWVLFLNPFFYAFQVIGQWDGSEVTIHDDDDDDDDDS